jgi:nitric oxide dioxygenase
MLSHHTKEIIKSTVPVLEAHGELITSRFYQMMFEAHPELKNIFNQTHQKLKDQPRALANAVYAAAANIDHLEDILPAIQVVFHKHRSIGIKPEHYPIVGKFLLLAIKDVLGDAATDEIIDAWKQTYGVLADIFITTEQNLYDKAEHQPGGWKGYRPFIVDKKIQESNVITSFYLKPADGQAIPNYLPGQYISLRVNIEGYDYTMIRQYSLSDAPGNDYYRISVKREDGSSNKPAGIVSTYLHQQVQVGDQLEISAPAGDFYLDLQKDTPVVLLSGGVGMTPLISMLNTMIQKQPERQIYYIHSAISGEYHAMKEYLQKRAEENNQLHYYVVYEKPTEDDRLAHRFHKEGYVDLDWLKTVIPNEKADFYFCGPTPYMKAIKKLLEIIGIPDENIHFEFFGPKGNLE